MIFAVAPFIWGIAALGLLLIVAIVIEIEIIAVLRELLRRR